MLPIYMMLSYFMPWASKKHLKVAKTSVMDERFFKNSGIGQALDFMVILSYLQVIIITVQYIDYKYPK